MTVALKSLGNDFESYEKIPVSFTIEIEQLPMNGFAFVISSQG